MGKRRTTISVEKMGKHYSVRQNNQDGTSWTLANGQFKTKPPAVKAARKVREELRRNRRY